MTEAEETCPVSWDEGWDDAIEAEIKAGRIAALGERVRDGGVLFTPGRLLLDESATDDDRVRSELDAAGLEPGRDEEAARMAGRLGLAVFEQGSRRSDDRLAAAVRRINEIRGRSASLDHVLVGGPARWGGDSAPQPVPDPGTIPGRDQALGEGITVAVLDTGIAKVPFPVDARPQDAEDPDSDHDRQRDPPGGHGTHVAGLVAAIAPGAKIVARRILTGVAGVASDLTVADALLDSAQADIVNCSFSGPALDDDQVPIVVERALRKIGRSTVVVACAGNQGVSRPQWPAAAKGVIAVGAIFDAGNGARPDFSNFGPWVDCCAPGVDVQSTFLYDFGFEGFASWSGTSMACPQVVGALAAIASRPGVGNVRDAVQRLIADPGRPHFAQLGTIVDPANLP